MLKRHRGLGYIQVNDARTPPDCLLGQHDRRAPTTLAQTSIEEIGQLHHYAADRLAAGLAVAHTVSQAVAHARGMTAGQKAALQQLRREYLWALLRVVNQEGMTNLDALRHDLPRPQRAAIQRQIDQIAHRYVQHVRIILWR